METHPVLGVFLCKEEEFTNPARKGSGIEGVVYKANHKVLGEKALKLWHNLSSLAVNRELSTMLKIDKHENIVQIDGLICSNRPGRYRGYFMEMMECSLNTIIHNQHANGDTLSIPPRDYDCKVVAKWINQINAGISFLHRNNIIHRDVKPTKIGTSHYNAPEIESGTYDYTVDIYAFSITLWEILHREKPSYQGNSRPLIDSRFPETITTFLKKGWNENPSIRPMFEEINLLTEYLHFSAMPIFEESEADKSNSRSPSKKKPRMLLTYDPALEVVAAIIDPDIDTYKETELGKFEVLQTVEHSEQGYILLCKNLSLGGYFGPMLVKYLGGRNEITRQFRDYSGVGMSAAVATQIRLAEDKKNPEREITFARELVHENIVRILGFISPDGRPDSINAIIMEGDFYGILEVYASFNNIPLQLEKAFALQLASALQYCHSRGIMHRDVRARNIYVQQDKMAIKLGNFGYARVREQDNIYSANKGEELCYRAPEIISSHTTTVYTVSVDVYGFALVLWSMLHGGRKPYKDDLTCERLVRNENRFKQHLVEGNRPRIDDNVDQGLANLIKECWINETEVDKRPSMNSVVQTLQNM